MAFTKLELVSILLIGVATIFMIVGVSTNYWIQTQDAEGIVQSSTGLWKTCTYNEKGEATCSSLTSQKNTGDGVFMEWADWLYVQKTVAFMSIILGVILLFAFFVYRCSDGKCARFIQAGLILMTTTSFLAFGLFVVHMPTAPPSLVRGYSFVLFTTGSCMTLIATCLTMFKICMPEKDSKTGRARQPQRV
ncbi:uncharacterized protein LOC135688177 [Rhopilema esculentum]|uniref:uncharacterized protein LOC135688177 n=1 Tax=Rhopilema esculentum TaxID=499914 RepID=UPI0031D17826